MQVKKVVTSVRLKPEVLAKLQAEAEKLDRSVSWIFGKLLEKHYE